MFTLIVTGRSRKLGGLSVLLAMPAIISKEKVNKHLVEIMHRAIYEVMNSRVQDVSNQVQKVRTHICVLTIKTLITRMLFE
jgi:hypothetical protein